MNSLNLYISTNCRLYILLFKYNLKSLYVNYRLITSSITRFFLHKKWLNNYTLSAIPNRVVNPQTHVKSLCYLYQHNNTYFTKYLHLTTLNYNINRNLTYVFSSTLKKLQTRNVYNMWFKTSHIHYNQHLVSYLFFLKTFSTSTSLFNLQYFNCLFFPRQPVTPKLNLIHNIKFL